MQNNSFVTMEIVTFKIKSSENACIALIIKIL